MFYFRAIIVGLIVLIALLAGQVLGQTPAERDPALTLINALGCKGCHRINNEGGSLAADLSQIGNRLSAEEILAQLTRHTTATKKQAQDQFMPAYRVVPQEDWQLISHYLSQLQQTE